MTLHQNPVTMNHWVFFFIWAMQIIALQLNNMKRSKHLAFFFLKTVTNVNFCTLSDVSHIYIASFINFWKYFSTLTKFVFKQILCSFLWWIISHEWYKSSHKDEYCATNAQDFCSLTKSEHTLRNGKNIFWQETTDRCFERFSTTFLFLCVSEVRCWIRDLTEN